MIPRITQVKFLVLDVIFLKCRISCETRPISSNRQGKLICSLDSPKKIHQIFQLNLIQKLTGGGRILIMPCCSAMGLIFSRYASASLNSSLVGVKTGHSGGGLKSYSGSVAILFDGFFSALSDFITLNQIIWSE